MKLKKIASLMLAGVMAVSMLAGCSNAPVTEEPEQQPETPATSNVADMLYSELTGSAKENVTAVANADLDSALEAAVDKYFEYTDIVDDVMGYNKLTPFTYTKVGESVKKAMGATAGILKSGINSKNDTSSKSAIAVYAVNASTSDEYAMEQVASCLDGYLTKLPAQGGTDHDWEHAANYNYTYTISASVTSRTVNFAGVDTGVKYVAVLLTKTVVEKG